MTATRFPLLALGLGVALLALLIGGTAERPDGSTTVPLLALLIASEFAFFVTAIGAFLAARKIRAQGMAPTDVALGSGCLVLSGIFLVWGLKLWPL